MANYVDYENVKLFYEHYIALCNLRSAINVLIDLDCVAYVPETEWNYVHRSVLYDLQDFGLTRNWYPNGAMSCSWSLTALGFGIMAAFDQTPGWVISIGNNKDVIIKLDPPEKPDNWEYE